MNTACKPVVNEAEKYNLVSNPAVVIYEDNEMRFSGRLIETKTGTVADIFLEIADGWDATGKTRWKYFQEWAKGMHPRTGKVFWELAKSVLEEKLGR